MKNVVFMDKQLIINMIIDSYGFKSDAEFARFLGISPQNLSKWKVRGTYDAELLYTKCPDLNPEWLLTGEGSMKKGNSQENVNILSDNNLNNNIKSKVRGDLTITNNDLTKLIELQKGSQEIQRELNKRLETSQSQINTLLEILKMKQL